MNEEDEKYCRIAYSCPERVMFLDIETIGFKYRDYITCIGWIAGGKYHYWLQGLDKKDFIAAFNKLNLVITFNGRSFDLKFLSKTFHSKSFTVKPNLDLMLMCKKFGFSGGQKAIEKTAGFERHAVLEGLNGRFAVEAWNAFMTGENEQLKLLIAYNFYDVWGMTYIMDWCIHKMTNIKRHFYDDGKASQKIVLPNAKECKKIRTYVLKTHVLKTHRKKCRL